MPMTMDTETSKPLRDSTFPLVNWVMRQQLSSTKIVSASTCSTVAAGEAAGDRQSNPKPPFRKRRFRSETTHHFLRDDSSSKKSRIPDDSKIDGSGCDDVNGIKAAREKILHDLKTEADKMRREILGNAVRNDGENVEENDRASSSAAASTSENQPWNLRPRRATSKAVINVAGRQRLHVEKKGSNDCYYYFDDGDDDDVDDDHQHHHNNNNNSSSEKNNDRKNQLVGRSEIDNALKWPIRLRVLPEKSKPCTVTVPLSKSEIEEDYMAILGHMPPRRPKHKRTRRVQKVLDTLSPGLNLKDISLDSYKVSTP